MTADDAKLAIQREALAKGAAVAAPVALLLWLGLRHLLPPIPDMDSEGARMMFAVYCIAVASLLTLLAGIEAVAHERLMGPALDPLAAAETPRMKINLRYLQNTVEQILLFAPGLLLLAHHSPDGGSMRAVAATTIVWIAARWVFWVGYHMSPLLRAPGLVGMVQSILVLFYGVFRSGQEMAGLIGGLLPILLFLMIEVVILFGRLPARR